MSNRPVAFRWDGEGMWPASGHWCRQADKEFVVGEIYSLVQHQERSTATHNHYFAAVTEGWRNLPDHLLEEYPTAEHLRKKALIRTGYFLTQDYVCGSRAEAERWAANLRPMDDYAIIVPKENVVRVFTAKSQSHRAMNATEFRDSKQSVLDFIDDLLGVERGQTADARAA